jgi:hypothetical protein
MVKSSSIIVYACISSMLIFLFLVTSHSPATEARCPDGYHESPNGDCEQVTHSGGLPKCPNGYHRSPSGDCEKVSSGETDNINLRPEENSQEESNSETVGKQQTI